MNSKRKCKHCREYHLIEGSIKTPSGWFCSREHAAEFAIEKSRAQKEKKQRAQAREARQAVKPIGYWMKRAQAAFNSYIRERDLHEPCVSCERYHEGQYHAGHYRSTGAAPMLRFEELNCHKQCSACNNHMSGNLVKYRLNLISKIGFERVEWLEGPHEPKRYRKEDYQAIESEYKEKLKQLKERMK